MTITRHAVTMFIELDSDIIDPHNLADALARHIVYGTFGFPVEQIDDELDYMGNIHARYVVPFDFIATSETKSLHEGQHVKGAITEIMNATQALRTDSFRIELTDKPFT